MLLRIIKKVNQLPRFRANPYPWFYKTITASRTFAYVFLLLQYLQEKSKYPATARILTRGSIKP